MRFLGKTPTTPLLRKAHGLYLASLTFRYAMVLALMCALFAYMNGWRFLLNLSIALLVGGRTGRAVPGAT